MRTIRFETRNLFESLTNSRRKFIFLETIYLMQSVEQRGYSFHEKKFSSWLFFFLFSYSRSLQQALAIFFQYFVQLGTLGLKWQDFLSFSPSTFKWCKGKIFEMADLRKNYERNFLIFYNFQEKKKPPAAWCKISEKLTPNRIASHFETRSNGSSHDSFSPN